MRTLFTLASVALMSLALVSSGMAGDSTCKGLYSVALTLYKQAQWGDATKVAKEALKKAGESPGPYCVDKLKCLQLLARLAAAQGNLTEALRVCNKAHAAAVTLYGPAHPSSVRSLIQRADLQAREGKYHQAEASYREAIGAAAKAGSVAELDAAPALVGIAGLYRNEGKDKEAQLLYEKALHVYELSRKYRPSLDGPIGQILCSLGDIEKDRKEFAAAADRYHSALEKLISAEGANSVRVADTRVRLADMYVAWHKPARAERQYKKALAAYRGAGGNELKAAVTMKRIGDLYDERGNGPLAERYYTKAVLTLRKCSPSCDSTLATVMKALADLRMKSGNHAQAIPVYRAVLTTLNMNPHVR